MAAVGVIGCQQQQIENVNDRAGGKEDIMKNIIESEDIPEGEEPGASHGGSILVHSNSFDDFSKFIDSGDVRNTPPPTSATTEEVQSASDDARSDTPLSVNTDDDDARDAANRSSSQKLVNGTREVDEEEEDWRSSAWRERKKHIFIMSYAGKPIYTRYGDEDQQAALMGVLQTLVMYFLHMAEPRDALLCVVAGSHKFVFVAREPLILVSASDTTESQHQLTMQLMYIYYQIISTLTAKRIRNIFDLHKNYDLRRMLSGAERQFSSLLDASDRDPCFMLGAVRCLPLESFVRDNIAQTMVLHSKVKDLVFAILIADNQLVMLVRLKNYILHPIEIHLICNLLTASESLKTSETWTPICLPKFEQNGFLYAHISYLDEACNICLLMITVNENLFHVLSNGHRLIAEKLRHLGCLKAISDSLEQNRYKTSDIGIPDIRHFLYKSKSASLFTSPTYEAPYASRAQQDRLLSLYQYVHQRLHSPTRPSRLLFHIGKFEAVLGWVTSGFELYIAFTPLVSKPNAVSGMEKLLRWIKKEEDRLFVRNPPTI